MINEPVVRHDIVCTKRICWTAIFVGALVGVGLGFLLNLFGIAIGLSAFTVSSTGVLALAIGGVLGIIVAVIVSMLVAGYAAGYLGRVYCPTRNLGILYGFTTWTLALLISAAVAGHVGDYVSAYAQTIAGSNVVLFQNSNGEVTAVNKTQESNPQAKMVTVTPTTPNDLAYGACLLFALFFIGAFSTCVGACWGMTCCRED